MAGLIWKVCCPIILYGLTIDMVSLLFRQWEPSECTAAGALIATFFLGRSYKREAECEERMDPKGFLCCAFTGISGCLAVNTVLRVSGILGTYQETAVTARMLWDTSPIFCVLSLGAVIPAAEELVFRGFVFGRLRKALGSRQAAWWSAALFGIYHGNMPQGIYGFVMGLLLARAMDREKTLLAPVVVHMAANLTAVAVTAAGFG